MDSERPYQPSIVRERISELAAKGQDAAEITRGHRGAITGRLIAICGSDEQRYRLLYYLFPHRWPSLASVTSKSLKNWDWYALYKWTDVHKDEEKDEWVSHPALTEECHYIISMDIEALNAEIDMEKLPEMLKTARAQLTPEQKELIDLGFVDEKPKRSEAEILEELGYGRTPTETYDPTTDNSMPIMMCGHVADMFSNMGMPFCGVCARTGNKPEAYQERSTG